MSTHKNIDYKLTTIMILLCHVTELHYIAPGREEIIPQLDC